MGYNNALRVSVWEGVIPLAPFHLLYRMATELVHDPTKGEPPKPLVINETADRLALLYGAPPLDLTADERARWMASAKNRLAKHLTVLRKYGAIVQRRKGSWAGNAIYEIILPQTNPAAGKKKLARTDPAASKTLLSPEPPASDKLDEAPQYTSRAGVPNVAACGHRLIDDRHCIYGCPITESLQVPPEG